jgi:hypothetical protein
MNAVVVLLCCWLWRGRRRKEEDEEGRTGMMDGKTGRGRHLVVCCCVAGDRGAVILET